MVYYSVNVKFIKRTFWVNLHLSNTCYKVTTISQYIKKKLFCLEPFFLNYYLITLNNEWK